MIRHRNLFSLVSIAAALAISTPAAAAVTKSAGPDEHPRAGWFERFQDSRQGPEQTERFSETYKIGAEGSLDLNHISGDVRVSAGRGNEVRVEAIKRVRHRDAAEGKRLLSLLRIETNVVGGRLEIRTVYPRTSSRSLSASVDYTITVPVGASVILKTISGDVSVNGVRGEVRAETVSGNVDVSGTPNLMMAKAISGDVRARDIATQSPVTLTTVSGTVTATALKAKTLECGAVSGDVQLSNVQVERLTAKNVSGDIDYDGTLARGGRYEFNSHSGNVRVVLPGNTAGFELDSSTFSGSIRSDFPVTLRSTTQQASSRGNQRGNQRAAISNRAVRGTYGDASAILSVRSFSGTVVITKK